MIKKLINIGVAILTVLSGIIVVCHFVLYYLAPLYLLSKYKQDLNGAASIGIIGGADGPTSIYLVDTVYQSFIPVFLILFISGIVYFVVLRWRKNRK